MKPIRVKIVQARTKGITGYVNLGRPGPLGNPWVVSKTVSAAAAAHQYEFIVKCDPTVQKKLAELLDRETPDGTLTIACPCNGVFKAQPCHATVIKQYLETLIAEREDRKCDYCQGEGWTPYYNHLGDLTRGVCKACNGTGNRY